LEAWDGHDAAVPILRDLLILRWRQSRHLSVEAHGDAFESPKILKAKQMKKNFIVVITSVLLVNTPAHAIDAKYRQKLERSGCTQMSEMQGCDINKSKAENAKANVVTETPAASAVQSAQANLPPYAGNWVAVGPTGATVAEIQINNQEQVKVNGKLVKAKRSDGALVFKQGFITYTIQGDRRLKGEDYWYDSDAKTKGPVNAK
jgi:hypothetical protein